MAKTILGVDIGYDNLKLALVSGENVKKTVSVPMPKNMIRDGQVVSVESVGEMIRSTMKEHGLRAGNAALALPNESVFVKSVALPVMTADQLEYNLPFEFRDYITGEIRDYSFDYAMYEKSGPATEGEEEKLEMFAAGAPKTVIDDARQMMRKAGLKLAIAAPAVSAYMQLIRRRIATRKEQGKEYCILDLGYQAVRMYIFRGERLIVTRILDVGLSGLDEVLAEACSVDVHLAHTYLMTDYEHCTRRDECMNAYAGIATELTRALNFYRFSSPEGNLEDIWLTGGGVKIAPLTESLSDSLDLQIHPAAELLPDSTLPDAESFIQAIGITMQ